MPPRSADLFRYPSFPKLNPKLFSDKPQALLNDEDDPKNRLVNGGVAPTVIFVSQFIKVGTPGNKLSKTIGYLWLYL